MAKVSFKRGDLGQRARSKVAESLKRQGKGRNVFGLATAITKRAGPAGRARLAHRGLRGR